MQDVVSNKESDTPIIEEFYQFYRYVHLCVPQFVKFRGAQKAQIPHIYIALLWVFRFVFATKYNMGNKNIRGFSTDILTGKRSSITPKLNDKGVIVTNTAGYALYINDVDIDTFLHLLSYGGFDEGGNLIQEQRDVCNDHLQKQHDSIFDFPGKINYLGINVDVYFDQHKSSINSLLIGYCKYVLRLDYYYINKSDSFTGELRTLERNNQFAYDQYDLVSKTLKYYINKLSPAEVLKKLQSQFYDKSNFKRWNILKSVSEWSGSDTNAMLWFLDNGFITIDLIERPKSSSWSRKKMRK